MFLQAQVLFQALMRCLGEKNIVIAVWEGLFGQTSWEHLCGPDWEERSSVSCGFFSSRDCRSFYRYVLATTVCKIFSVAYYYSCLLLSRVWNYTYFLLEKLVGCLKRNVTTPQIRKKTLQFQSQFLIEPSLFFPTYLIRMLRIQVLRKLAPHLETSKMMKAFFWEKKITYLLEELVEFKKNHTQTHSLLLTYESVQNRNALRKVLSSHKQIQPQ